MTQVNQSNCYALGELLVGEAIPEELRPATLLAWSDRLAGLGGCAPVALILKLEYLGRIQMPGADRILLMQLLEGPLTVVLDGMSRVVPRQDPGVGQEEGYLTMGQRLICAAYRNFAQALHDLDDVPRVSGTEQAEKRLWGLEQQFALLDRQIRCAVRDHSAPPAGTWRELHGRFQYFLEHFARDSSPEADMGVGDDFDALSAYKRLLLLGSAARALGEKMVNEAFMTRLKGWAAESRLELAGAPGIGGDGWIVELAHDGPPRKLGDSASLGPGGWVLVPAAGFSALVQASGQARSGDPAAG